MTIKTKLALSAGLVAIVTGMSYGQPAQANDLVNFFRDYMGIAPNVYSPNAHEQMTQQALVNQRNAIEARIAASLAGGQISVAQAADFRAQLANNANLQAQYVADGRLTYPEAQTLVNALTNMDNLLSTTITSSTNVAVNPYYGYTPPSGYYRTDRIDRLQARLANRLERARVSGRLTPTEYASLKAEFDRVSAREAQMRTSKGFLSRAEHDRLMARLNRLDSNISVQVADRDFGRWNSRSFWNFDRYDTFNHRDDFDF